jgi:hypothetical protein
VLMKARCHPCSPYLINYGVDRSCQGLDYPIASTNTFCPVKLQTTLLRMLAVLGSGKGSVVSAVGGSCLDEAKQLFGTISQQ